MLSSVRAAVTCSHQKGRKGHSGFSEGAFVLRVVSLPASSYWLGPGWWVFPAHKSPCLHAHKFAAVRKRVIISSFKVKSRVLAGHTHTDTYGMVVASRA